MQNDACQAGSTLVRHAILHDAETLVGLITQLAAHHGDRATIDGVRLREDLFTSPAWATTLVAEQAGCLVGYALLVRLYCAHFATRTMDLHHLFVLPEVRSSGVGQALIRSAITEAAAQSCGQLVVGTHPSNLRAQAFYRKLGFREASEGGPKFKLQIQADV